jgi:hypothetical protein
MKTSMAYDLWQAALACGIVDQLLAIFDTTANQAQRFTAQKEREAVACSPFD